MFERGQKMSMGRFERATCVLLLIGGIPLGGCAPSESDRPAVLPADAFRIASFNIHYVAPWQTGLAWDRRKHAVRDVIADIDADIIGIQEMETFEGGHYNDENRQLDWVLSHYPSYAAGAVGDPREYPSTQPILYRRARFRQLEQGFFFFSNAPHIIYSSTFNGSYPAFCSWSKLEDLNTRQRFYVFNVHFDFKSFTNRSKSATLVAERIRPLVSAGESVILLGDINALSFFPTANKLKQIPLTLAPPRGGTFHFNRGINMIPAIDHILYTRDFSQIGDTVVVRDAYGGIWPADHYPLWVALRNGE